MSLTATGIVKHIKSEIHALIKYVEDHVSFHEIAEVAKSLLKFLEEHVDAVVKVVKASIASIKRSTSEPLTKEIGEVMEFPKYPNAENVIEWLTKILIPEILVIFNHLKKDVPEEAKYIGVMAVVLDDTNKMLKFVKLVVY